MSSNMNIFFLYIKIEMDGITAALIYSADVNKQFVCAFAAKYANANKKIARLLLKHGYLRIIFINKLYKFLSDKEKRECMCKLIKYDIADVINWSENIIISTPELFSQEELDMLIQRHYSSIMIGGGYYIPESVRIGRLNYIRYVTYPYDNEDHVHIITAQDESMNALMKNENIHDYAMYMMARKICDGNKDIMDTFCEQMRESRPLLYIFNNSAGLDYKDLHAAILNFVDKYHKSPFDAADKHQQFSKCLHGSHIMSRNITRDVYLCSRYNCAFSAFIHHERAAYITLCWQRIELRTLYDMVCELYPQYLDHFDNMYIPHEICQNAKIDHRRVTPLYYAVNNISPDRCDRIMILARFGKSPHVVDCIYKKYYNKPRFINDDVDIIRIIWSEIYDGACVALEQIFNDYPRFLLFEQNIKCVTQKSFWPMIARLLFQYPEFLCELYSRAAQCFRLKSDNHSIDMFGKFIDGYNIWYANYTSRIIAAIKIGATLNFGEDIAEIIIAEYKLRRKLI
jgi:hypothetical protein